MTKKYFHIIFLICAFAFSGLSQSEKLVRLAEPFSVTVEVAKDSLPPMTGKEWGPFTVINATGNLNNSKYEIQLVAYDTGLFSIPFTAMANQKNHQQIRVLAPLDKEIKEYSPLREVGEAPEKIPLWKWLVFFGGIVSLAFALWYLYKIRKRQQPLEQAGEEDAILNILRLKEGWANQTLNSIELGDGLVSSLRTCYRVNTKRSSRQLLLAIENDFKGLPGKQIEGALLSCDAWRFGKRKASLDEGLGAIGSIEKIMRQIPQKNIPIQTS